MHFYVIKLQFSFEIPVKNMIIVNKTLFSHIFVKKKYLEAQMKAKLHVVIQYKFWFNCDRFQI